MFNKNDQITGYKKADVVAKANEVKSNLLRDADELKKQNVTPDDINKLGTLAEAAGNSHTDEIALAKQVFATTTKNNAKNALIDGLEETQNMLTGYFKGNTDELQLYKLTNLSGMSDAQLTISAGNFINLLNANPDMLKAANIDSAFMDDLSAKLTAFVTSQSNCVEAKRERKEAAITGSQAFTDLIQHMGTLCLVAKNYWLQKSDNRYTDYVLHRSSKSAASPPAPVTPPATTPASATDNSAA